LHGQHCQLAANAELIGFAQPDFRRLRTLIIAPHADDAELAAFGYYQRASDVHIVTVTVGELEAEDYQAYGLSAAAATELKARLRTWDSLAIPQWAGLAPARCWQLGYFCLQLQAMQQQPQQSFGSRVAPLTDTRPYRQHNPQTLPADQSGTPSWQNLVSDLRALLDQLQPDVIITPHPALDPHSDHVACTAAVAEAMAQAGAQVRYLLHYANHLHDNDRWPMGNAHTGVAPAPVTQSLAVESLCSLPLTAAQQIDKAMALRMQHDLQPPLSAKKRLRRCFQYWLAGRRWPAYGDSEFFRKAVRRHELFIVRRV
jgi:LmbE family N-acetylglucosaminyl deacetylase